MNVDEILNEINAFRQYQNVRNLAVALKRQLPENRHGVSVSEMCVIFGILIRHKELVKASSKMTKSVCGMGIRAKGDLEQAVHVRLEIREMLLSMIDELLNFIDSPSDMDF
jgi:hypothetical protein